VTSGSRNTKRAFTSRCWAEAQNSNEVAKLAKIPTSKAYAVLDKLAVEGVVETFKHGNATWFTAIDPAELIERPRSRYNSPPDFLSEAF
jgi:sugar-specific transcriptional regulator TrmB